MSGKWRWRRMNLQQVPTDNQLFAIFQGHTVANTTRFSRRKDTQFILHKETSLTKITIDPPLLSVVTSTGQTVGPVTILTGSATVSTRSFERVDSCRQVYRRRMSVAGKFSVSSGLLCFVYMCNPAQTSFFPAICL